MLFTSFKYEQQKAAQPAGDNIVKKNIYLQKCILYVISQGMISLF